jgi:hypothetical protein
MLGLGVLPLNNGRLLDLGWGANFPTLALGWGANHLTIIGNLARVDKRRGDVPFHLTFPFVVLKEALLIGFAIGLPDGVIVPIERTVHGTHALLRQLLLGLRLGQACSDVVERIVMDRAIVATRVSDPSTAKGSGVTGQVHYLQGIIEDSMTAIVDGNIDFSIIIFGGSFIDTRFIGGHVQGLDTSETEEEFGKATRSPIDFQIVRRKQHQPTSTDQCGSWHITILSTVTDHDHILSFSDRLYTDPYDSTRVQTTFYGFGDVAITYVDTHQNLIDMEFGSLGSDKSFSGTSEFNPETRLRTCINDYRFDDVILILAPHIDSNGSVTAL